MPDTAGDGSRGSFVGIAGAEKVKNDIYSDCTTEIEQRRSRHRVLANKRTHARTDGPNTCRRHYIKPNIMILDVKNRDLLHRILSMYFKTIYPPRRKCFPNCI